LFTECFCATREVHDFAHAGKKTVEREGVSTGSCISLKYLRDGSALQIHQIGFRLTRLPRQTPARKKAGKH